MAIRGKGGCCILRLQRDLQGISQAGAEVSFLLPPPIGALAAKAHFQNWAYPSPPFAP